MTKAGVNNISLIYFSGFTEVGQPMAHSIEKRLQTHKTRFCHSNKRSTLDSLLELPAPAKYRIHPKG